MGMREPVAVARPLKCGNHLTRFSLRSSSEGVARSLIFGISSGPLLPVENPMQPTQPHTPMKPDVPRLQPTVFKTVAELAALPACDRDVHLSRIRSTS